MSNWFGNLQLAYKYIVVFLGLLVIVILAGFVKVLFNRNKLSKAKAKEASELEAGPKEDLVELNQREKDEGDLFGIRAIEAGFYAGVAQSRPTSRAGSVIGIDHPSMSNSTLVGGSASSPLMKGQSANNSMLSLNLGNEPQRKSSQPTSKLRPSDAEMNGRRYHSAADTNLQVPPSPGHPRGQTSPTYGSDSESDGFTSPRSMSPADFNSKPDALNASYHAGDANAPRSQAASFNNSPGPSPTPASPRNPPTTRLPTIPNTAMRKESRSPSPEFGHPEVRVYQPSHEPAQPSAPQLQPRTYDAAHKRDASDASSNYSHGNRLSTFQAYQAYQNQADNSASSASNNESYSYNYNYSSSADESGHTSVILSSDKEGDRRPSQTSSHLAPAPASTLQPGGSHDPRLSEFYESYYRHSQAGLPQVVEPTRLANRQSTIIEVESPMPSPLFPKVQQPGAAY